MRAKISIYATICGSILLLQGLRVSSLIARNHNPSVKSIITTATRFHIQATSTASSPTLTSLQDEATTNPPEPPLLSAEAKSTTSSMASVKPILNSFYKRLSQPTKYGLHLKLKGYVLNMWGVVYALSILTTAISVLPVIYLLSLYADCTGNGARRRTVDWMIHIWARASMSLLSVFGQTRVYGKENLPPMDETVVYVPNHTSYFDILLMSGYVPRPFKYLSKAEILDIPVIGLGMKLARHVFLKRNDIQSTIACADTCTERLKDGNSMVLFAEGTRSPDGCLKQFKKGAFQMAKAAGVRIVPVSIGNLHRLMPANCPLPIASMKHTYVKIHPPIETQGRKIKEIKNDCFDAVNSGLPPYQKFESGSS